MRSIREYCRVTLPLIVVLALYQFFAVPYIEPPIPALATVPNIEAPKVAEVYWWSNYFVPGAWQNQGAAFLKTKTAVLIYRKSEKLGPDRLKLSPLTIVLPRGQGDILGSQTPDGGVLFIENPEGAEIQFKEAIDITGGERPDVIGGRLIGPVQLVGSSSKDGKTDFWLETRDVALDRKHLWTLHPVKMKIGTSQIEGRDLSIYLDRNNLLSPQSSQQSENSPFQGMDRLELMYLDRAEIDLPNGGLWSPKEIKGTLPARASLLCKGSFQFDFHSSTAHLANDVQVTHQVQGQAIDQFSCDDLRLRLSVPDKAQKNGPAQQASSAWSLEYLEATGKLQGDESHPGWWVRLESPGMKTRAQGRHLEIDLVRGRLALANHVGNSKGTEKSRVFVEREGMRVWSPGIQIENEDLIPNLTRPPSLHLGTLWADGPGSAQMIAEDNDIWKLSWGKRLMLQPDGEQDQLTIDGSANASSLRHGRFSSDVLDLWLFRLPPASQKQLAMLHPGRKTNSIFADRFHARGQVTIDSNLLRAQVEDMQVWLVHPELSKLGSSPNPNDSSIQLNPSGNVASTPLIVQPNSTPMLPADPLQNQPLASIASNPALPASVGSRDTSSSPPSLQLPELVPSGVGRLATFPDSSRPGLATAGPSPSAKPLNKPLSVTGPLLRSKVIVEPDRTMIDDLEIEGGVTLIQDRLSEGSTLPMTITGDKLKLNTAEAGMADVQIVGTPALIRFGSGQIQGPEVRYNQRSQLVWIDHPGSLVLPPEILNAPRPGVQGSQIRWIEPPFVEWKGNLTFDGKMARIGGGVRFTSDFQSDAETRWVMVGDCEILEVHLTAPIAMGQPSMNQGEIDRVVFKNNVDIRATQSDPSGRVEKSRERLSLPELSFDLRQQSLLGVGPGWIRSRRPGQAGASIGNHPLNCLHLTFGGYMRGAITKGSLEFQNRIEALYGPIRSWEDSLDVNQLQRLSIDQTLLTCDKIQIDDTSDLSWNNRGSAPSGQSKAWELKAIGTVAVDSVLPSGEIKVRAPQIQFSGLDDLLKIYGAPNDPGVIDQKNSNRPGTSPINLVVSYLEVNVRTLDHGKMKLHSAMTGSPSGFAPPTNGPPNSSSPIGPSGGGNLPSPRDFPVRRK